MGLQDVRLYDASWYEWGSRQRYFPAETLSREFTGKALPKPGMIGGAGRVPAPAKKAADSGTTSEQPKGGYVSCGG
jgi:thiosulfate/3-mercaptopyruvate sulfurtransferase